MDCLLIRPVAFLTSILSAAILSATILSSAPASAQDEITGDESELEADEPVLGDEADPTESEDPLLGEEEDAMGAEADVTEAPPAQSPDLLAERQRLEAKHRDEELVGIRGFGGVALGGGVTLHTWTNAENELEGPETYGAWLFALRGGLMLERMEIMLEWAPGTFSPLANSEPAHIDAGERMFSFLGSVAYHIPVTKLVYWPVRLGAGIASSRNDFLARVDLLNLSVKTKYVLLDFSFPSIRYMSDFDRYHRWSGLFLASASYISP